MFKVHPKSSHSNLIITFFFLKSCFSKNKKPQIMAHRECKIFMANFYISITVYFLFVIKNIGCPYDFLFFSSDLFFSIQFFSRLPVTSFSMYYRRMQKLTIMSPAKSVPRGLIVKKKLCLDKNNA